MGLTEDATSAFRGGSDQLVRPSAEQAAIALIDQLHGPGSSTVVVSVEVDGRVDTSALARAWRSLIERHPALRASFESRGGQLSVRLRPPHAADEPSLSVIELDVDAERTSAITGFRRNSRI